MLGPGPSRGGSGLSPSASIRRIYWLSNHPGSSRWLAAACPSLSKEESGAIFILEDAAPRHARLL